MSTYDIDIIAGNTLLLQLTANGSDGLPINLSGYGARGYIRYSYGSTGVLFDLNPQIHPSYASGLVSISGNATDTANLIVGRVPYDLEIFNSGGYVTKFLRGYANISPEVTW